MLVNPGACRACKLNVAFGLWSQAVAGTGCGTHTGYYHVHHQPTHAFSIFLHTLMAVRGPKSNQLSDLNWLPGEQSRNVSECLGKVKLLLYRESFHPKPRIQQVHLHWQGPFVFLFPYLSLLCVAKCLFPRLASLSFIQNLNSLPHQPESLSLGNENGETGHRKSDIGRPWCPFITEALSVLLVSGVVQDSTLRNLGLHTCLARTFCHEFKESLNTASCFHSSSWESCHGIQSFNKEQCKLSLV